MRASRTATALAIVLGLSGGSALAAQDGAAQLPQDCQLQGGKNFSQLDADGNGYVTQKEFMDCIGQKLGDVPADVKNEADRQFAQADRNGDNSLGQNEIGAERSAQASGQDTAGTGTQVQVKQPPADVTVQERQPQVQVEEKPAQVIVKQPEPEVIVKQPDPDVTVTQPEPKVMVEQQKPQVQVKEAEPTVKVEDTDPKVKVQQAGETEQNKDKQKSDTQASQMSGSASQDMTTLEGMSLVGSNGEDLGEISQVVQDDSGKTFAVVTMGGILGFGGEDVVVPIDQIEAGQDNAKLTGSTTPDDLKNMPKYDEAKYKPASQ
jgi:sporulation protein YlmC with PRC-barrel domain